MNSPPSVNSCLGSACNVPSDPTSAHTVLLQEKSLTRNHYKCIRYIHILLYILKSHRLVRRKAQDQICDQSPQTSALLHPESPNWFHISRPNMWHLMNNSHFSYTTAAETGSEIDSLLCIIWIWTISIFTVRGRPIRWKMNGLEERRGILATIWLFHIMMDGAPQNGVGVLTHIYTAQTHTRTCMHFPRQRHA